MAIKIGIATYPFRESFQYAFNQEIPIVKENPNLEELSEYDLIIFSGGADISSRFYGESPTYTRGVNNERDQVESDILDKARLLGIKIFGVCRGHQLINAKLGGKLIQDLFMGQKPNLIHSSPHPLEKISSDRFLEGIDIVNSLHHQGVVMSGKGLQGTSVYKGIIETTLGKNIYSVQFHPEFMLDSKEIRDFFDFFKGYVEKNPRKKDPSKVSLNDIPSSAYSSDSRPSRLTLQSGLDIMVRGSNNVEEFISTVRRHSNLNETDLQLQIIPEHESFLRELYDRKNSFEISVANLNTRDEELYMMMEESEEISDEDYEDYEMERSTISDEISLQLNGVVDINSRLMDTAREMIDSINQGGWNNNSTSEGSERVSVDESSTVSSNTIDWAFLTDSS